MPLPAGTHCTGKTGKMAKKKSPSGKTHGIWKFCQNTGNLVCSSYKFPDSQGKRYFDIYRENFQICLKLDKSAKSVLCYTLHKLAQGKCAVKKEQGKHREFENEI